MKKLVMIDGRHYPEPGAFTKVEALCKEKGVLFEPLFNHSTDEYIAQAQDADACLLTISTMDGYALSRMPKLRMAVRLGIGVDSLNLTDFTAHGVYACNVPDYGVEEVAVHALALLLACERKIPCYSNSVHRGEWNEDLGYPMRRLSCRTLGFLGFGRIARKLSTMTKPLGYAMLAYDPHLPDNFFAETGARKVDLDTLLGESDAIVVLAPANEETYHIINDANLAKARDGLTLVTTSRGSLVDTAAAIRALGSGKLRCAAFDVLEEEPPAEKCKVLLGIPNVILSPHAAYRSVESLEALKFMAAETAVEFLTEGKIRNVVNPEVMGKARP